MEQKIAINSVNRIEISAPHFEIALRQFGREDVGAIFDLIGRNKNYPSQFGDETANKYPDRESVENSIINPKNPKRVRLGIWNDLRELVGSINLTPDEGNPQKGEIGYYLGSEFTKKGYMLNAVLTLTTYAFTHLDYEEIYGKIHFDNFSSQEVLTKAGFKKTGEKNGDKIFTLKKP